MWLVQFFKVPVFAENCGCGRRYIYLVSISIVLKITKAFCKLKPCGPVAISSSCSCKFLSSLYVVLKMIAVKTN